MVGTGNRSYCQLEIKRYSNLFDDFSFSGAVGWDFFGCCYFKFLVISYHLNDKPDCILEDKNFMCLLLNINLSGWRILL